MEEQEKQKTGVDFNEYVRVLVNNDKSILYFHTIYGKFIVFQN